MTDAPRFEDVIRAQRRIAPYIHRTPVLTSRPIDSMIGARIFFKCENLQRSGAFKARGAFNAVFALDDADAARGVVTHSSGNHAAALALAASTRGIPAYVVMPNTAPAPKKAAVAGYGARIVECEPTLAARLEAAEAIAAETGATMIPPFDHPLVAAGQGTAVLDLLNEAGEPLDAVTVPVGGGGLLAGTLLAVEAASPETRVIGAEPAMADDATRGFVLGKLQPQVLPVRTVADGLTTSMSPMTFGIMRDKVSAMVTASEDAIVEAMRLVWTRLKVVAEPSAVVPLAALMEGAWDARGQSVGLILTGGNVDLDRLPWMPRS